MAARRRKRKRSANQHRRLVDELISMKVKNKLSEKQLLQVIHNMHTEDADAITKLVRDELKHNGYHAHRLHGCTTCNDFIWLHSEKIPCQNCNNDAGRYDAAGNPLEEVFYFALLPRLAQMYRDSQWRRTLTYPDSRPIRRTQRADVFDGTEYKRLRRAAGRCEYFVTFAHVADAVSSNKRMSRSILPGILSILNYDPRVRYQAQRNLLLTFLMPPKIKTSSAQKFYELLEDELSKLFYTGIAGGKLKGALLMTRADQKGKEFDLGLRSCTSYDAPCSVCEIMANPGVGPFTKTSVEDYRRFLPANHPYRRDPTFGANELRALPAYRTKQRSNLGVEIAQDVDTALPYYQGYVHFPLFHSLRYYRPFRQSAADLSHNLANFFGGIIANCRPTDAMISKWRREACWSGRFFEISTEAQQTLDVDIARELRGLHVGDYMTVTNLRELADVVGVARAGNKGELITRLRAVIQSINNTGTVVVSVGKGPIPWVLTDDEVRMVNNRFKSLVLPPHVHAFCTTEEGLFDNKSSCWRMISKMQVFMMLPVLLLGTLPAIRGSLTKIVHGIMLLNGRVISERVRRAKG